MTRPVKGGDEQDVFTGWRKVMCWTQRAGACKRVKRRANRRERREGRQLALVEIGEDAPPAVFFDQPDDWPDEERDCTHCGGEPDMIECDDPIQCCKPGCDGVLHGCDACNGTGRRSQQWSF